MATTKIQQEMTGIVQNFISLWNRYYALYLEKVSRHDITAEKENEFLKFQGTIAEQLVSVLELDEKSRFDINDKVMSVINEVVSLDFYTKMSEFQSNRVKRQWQEAMEELEKLYRFCDTYDLKVDKVLRISEVKKKNPYWDPTSGSMRSVLTRIAVAPVTFFQGLKAGTITPGIGSFLFFTILIPIVIILTFMFILNFTMLKIIAKNVVVEAGLLSSGEAGFVPSLIIAAAILAGLLILSLAFTIVLTVLHHIFSWFLHFGFKLTGAKEPYNETFKAVTYGVAPIVAGITAPYTAVLQIIGASKVHKYPYILSAIGWLIGAIVFLAFVFVAVGAAFYFTGVVPPVGKEYAFVTADKAELLGTLEMKELTSVFHGTYLDLPGKKGEVEAVTRKIGEGPNRRNVQVYEIKYNDKTYYVEDNDVDIIEFTWSKFPRFIILKSVSSIDAVRSFLDKIIKKYSD